MSPGQLVICASPIGNLGDAPPRLGQALAGADLILAEDTRRARMLMDHLGVSVQVVSYFVGNEADRADEVRRRLAAGERLALLTDAGTPAVSDPGLSAVRIAQDVGATVTVVPGPSAATAALSVSGLPSDRFVFEGFLPRRGQDRVARLQSVARDDRTTVLFSAPSRLLSDLEDLAEACGADRTVVIGRELTKLHEEVWRGTLAGAATEWAERTPRGEFTLVLAGAQEAPASVDEAVAEVAARMKRGEAMSAAVKAVAEVTGVRRRRLYEAALAAGLNE
jgi:16S rRNA (cytidine1402-2'-O)-methyltransferase